MNQPMKPAAPSLTVTLEVIDPLRGTLLLGGYEAELVVRRTDGQPMTAHDREQAAWLLEESEKREASDAEVGAQARAILAAEKAPKTAVPAKKRRTG